MKIISNPQKLNEAIKKLACKGKTTGFVPTMGALHLGHISLLRQAKKENDIVVISIFVNPIQFGPQEDFKRYPRPLKKDLELLRKYGVDFIFLPSEKDMYGQNFCTFIEVTGLSNKLCGLARPGHFKGVATVVAKLLNIVRPNTLYLGQKDGQQAIIIKRLIRDLNFYVKLKIMPTVREGVGLALSSRNIYLNKQQKKQALVLYRSLILAKALIKNGLRDTVRIISRIKELINRNGKAKIDYVSIVDLENLEDVKKLKGDCLIALAVKIGKVRLIDNILIKGIS